VVVTSIDAHRVADLVRMRRVKDRIDREFAQPLDVEALARGAHMSAGHLSREFRAAYGESPYSYLMTRRIERAMTLLRRGDLSVTEVCFAVGCSSLGSFSSRFSELVGISPSAYRKLRAGDAALPGCVAKEVLRPVRNREAAGQPQTSIVLHPPAVDPGLTDDERRTIAELMTPHFLASHSNRRS
jgi:AraC-like DNA-binding protein